MLLMIVPFFCFLFGPATETFQCVGDAEKALAILQTNQVKEVLWAPGFLEDTQPFLKFLKEKYPSVKVQGIDLWTTSTDFCGYYLGHF